MAYTSNAEVPKGVLGTLGLHEFLFVQLMALADAQVVPGGSPLPNCDLELTLPPFPLLNCVAGTDVRAPLRCSTADKRPPEEVAVREGSVVYCLQVFVFLFVVVKRLHCSWCWETAIGLLYGK